MPLHEGHADDPFNRLWLHYFISTYCFKTSLHMSARTKEAKTPSSLARRLSGVSYSKIFPRFITITRSAVRIVWTRCCEWKKRTCICYRFQGTGKAMQYAYFIDYSGTILYLGALGGARDTASFSVLFNMSLFTQLLNAGQCDWVLDGLYSIECS